MPSPRNAPPSLPGSKAPFSVGPLKGLRVLEFAGIGPAPFACMLLADMGAEVVCVKRLSPGALAHAGVRGDVLSRGRRLVSADLKKPEAVEVMFKLLARSDVLVEGFRPGTMERLGLGPEPCFKHKRDLIYARMTGWGQKGPLAHAAGHDLNYIALSGALHAIGSKESGPAVPLNLLGDFGGGSLYLVMGILAALYETRRSGEGQVVDAAITDGVASLMASTYSFFATGMWEDARRSNMLDGGAPYYDVYQCSDGEWITIAAIEPQFYKLLGEKLGTDLGDSDLLKRMDKTDWTTRKQQIKELIKQRTRDEWCALLEGSDVCFAPVLSMSEAPRHPQNRERGTFVTKDGVTQPVPAPRFERTPSECPGAPEMATDVLLHDLGYDDNSIARLKETAALG